MKSYLVNNSNSMAIANMSLRSEEKFLIMKISSWHFFFRLMSHFPKCPRKCEGAANIEGEGEGLALAGQRLAEILTLQ